MKKDDFIDYINYRICNDVTRLEEYLVGNCVYTDVIDIIADKERSINLLEGINNEKLLNLFKKVIDLATDKFKSDYKYKDKIQELLKIERATFEK